MDKIWWKALGWFEETTDLTDLSSKIGLKGIKDALMQNHEAKNMFPNGFEKLEIVANIITNNIDIFIRPASQTLWWFLRAVQKTKWLSAMLLQINNDIDLDELNEYQKWMAYVLLAYANILRENNPSSVTDLSNMGSAYCSIKPSWEQTVMVRNGDWKYVDYDSIAYDPTPNKSYWLLANWLIGTDFYDFAPKTESVVDSVSQPWVPIDPVVVAQQAINNPAWIPQTETKTA